MLSSYVVLSVLLSPLLASAGVIPERRSGSALPRIHRRDHVDDVNVCRPLGDEKCTFTVIASLKVIPNFTRDPSGNLDNAVDGKTFVVLNNKCDTIASMDRVTPQGTGKGFSGPVTAEGFGEDIQFHADSIGLGNTSGIKFSYAGKEYTDCHCEAMNGGVFEGKQGCRCEFDCPKSSMSTDGFRKGTCWTHITQHQKPNPSKDQYKLDIGVFDGSATPLPIGGSDGVDAPSGKAIEVESKLPSKFVVTANNVDDDPINFSYNDQKWDSKSQQCSVGGYDNGSRQMDCHFSC